jgi:D-alanine-D-alanine ligase
LDKIHVGLIFGGRSGEHEVSVRGAESVREALRGDRYAVHDFYISKNGKWQPGPLLPEPGANPGLDVVFPLLHGTFGEDGTIQGLLELAELPYVGAGVLGSALSMDKAVMKRLCAASGLPVVEHVVLDRKTMNGYSSSGPHEAAISSTVTRIPFALPVFVKPANLGSSVGISKAKDHAALLEAVVLAERFDRKIIIERGIEGREFECSVLDGCPPRAATPCEIFPSREFYDYEDKYLLNQARIELPARLTEQQTEEIRRLAVACFCAVECEGMARVDFLMESETGKIFINEINTIPGFTSISMFARMWEHDGLAFAELLDTLIELAIERAAARRQLSYSR